MPKSYIFLVIFTTLLSLSLGWWLGAQQGFPWLESGSIVSPFVEKVVEKQQPLLKYSLKNLQNYPYQASNLIIESVIEDEANFTSYVFSYRTLNKKMTGQINVPASPAPAGGYPVIIMMRGWAPESTYRTGTGTRPAATVYARNGYVTIAPDFFGYGGSDPELDDNWEARFQKPVNVIELLKTIEAQSSVTIDNQPVRLNSSRIGFWAHSNGGQITLATLEILERPIPSTLWAPVTAPFPYSVLFFTNEDDDDGKQFRKHLANFEKDYDVFEFSLKNHLSQLTGPIQIHQGTADEAVPVAWNRDFADLVAQENERRTEIMEKRELETALSTEAAQVADSAQATEKILPLIDLTLFIYPGADHNLRPGWDTVVQRDLQFFNEHLTI